MGVQRCFSAPEKNPLLLSQAVDKGALAGGDRLKEGNRGCVSVNV